MFIHKSGEVPSAAASRRAMFAEIPALPFNTRDSVTRVVRRCSAAVDTGMSPRYSRRTEPGWGGLCMRIEGSLVIVLIVDVYCILAFKLERQTPVPAYADRPVILECPC